MGADAHPVIEVFDGSEWVTAQCEEDYDYEKMPEPIRELGHRSYNRFAILAGVRDQDGIEPLFAWRKLPRDLSGRADSILDSGCLHSHTYFTLQEILEMDWTTVAIRRKVPLNGEDYQYYLDHGGLPADWNYRWAEEEISEEEMALRLIGGKVGDAVVRLELPITYRDLDPHFHAVIVPGLQKLADEHGVGPEHVRVLIAFDS